jgi:hypothetical protein
MASDSKPGPCNPACTKVVKFMTDHDVPPSVGLKAINTGRFWAAADMRSPAAVLELPTRSAAALN